MAVKGIFQIIFFACGFLALSVNGQQPPKAVLLDGVMERSSSVFIGVITSGSIGADGRGRYEFRVKDTLVGGAKMSGCFVSSAPYSVGREMVFFLPKAGDDCVDAGALKRSLDLRNIGSSSYVVLGEEGYIYPDFRGAMVVQSIPWKGVKPFVLWTGVPLPDFRKYVESVRNKHQK